MKFPEGLPPTTVGNLKQMHVSFPPGVSDGTVVAVHPTQIYETALMLLVFAWLWRLRDHRHATGWRFRVYLVRAGTERFLIEILPAKDDPLLAALALSQVTNGRLALVAAWLVVRRPPPAATPQP